MRHLLTNIGAIVIAMLAFTVVAVVHAGEVCWVQGLNYMVASIPFGLSCGHALRWRLRGESRSRRLSVWYSVIFLVIALYSWRSVESHRVLIAEEEAALQPTIAALQTYRTEHGRYPGTLAEIGKDDFEALRFRVFYTARDADRFSLSFPHNIFRQHSYLSETSEWVDW